MPTQKTLTVNGKRFSGKQIAGQFNDQEMTEGGDYIVNLNGEKFYGNYRQIQDYYAPTCDAADANAVALMPDDGYYKWSKWLCYKLATLMPSRAANPGQEV